MNAGALLALLVVLLPFEPRRPTLDVLGLHFTLLEAATAVISMALAVLSRPRLESLARARPWPLLALWLYAAAHVISAAATPYHADLARRFSLRMVAMAVFATLVAALPAATRRRGWTALATGSLAVAALALAEAAGLRALDPLLDLFREGPVQVAGVRRATAGSEHPNLAAAFLMYGMVAGAALGGPIQWTVARSALLALGLACTYSRGAAAAALVGLLVLAARDRRRASGPLISALVLVAAVAILAAAHGGLRPVSALGARYEPAESALSLTPGESRTAEVRVTNTGREVWSPREVHLSYHWLRDGAAAVSDGPRVPMPRPIAPGETVTVRADVQAPAEPGAYRLVWDLLARDHGWLSAHGIAPAAVPVIVGVDGAAPPSPDPVSALSWHPTRAELWSVALRLWWERPLLGIGPDNFRRLYGRAAGRALWDPRLYANHMLLEAAATTGLLGALALVSTLALTLWRAARSTSADAPACFALMAGIAAHGLLDSVLAMTGHYLVFGLVVGSAGEADR